MVRMSFRLPVVEQEPEVPSRSPCCRSGFIRHQRSMRGLTDIRIGEAAVQRYRCVAHLGIVLQRNFDEDGPAKSFVM